MSSGVAVSDEVKNCFQQVKMNSKCKLRYGIFRIGESLKDIIIDKDRMITAPESARDEPCHFMDVIGSLPQDDGRYIVYDYPYTESYGETSKLILILWCPKDLSIKRKMLYASSKDALKKVMSEVTEFQADCADDLHDKDITSKLRRV